MQEAMLEANRGKRYSVWNHPPRTLSHDQVLVAPIRRWEDEPMNQGLLALSITELQEKLQGSLIARDSALLRAETAEVSIEDMQSQATFQLAPMNPHPKGCADPDPAWPRSRP